MAEQSNIGWTMATWNPWHGCIKISAGCKNCYMYRDKARYGQDPKVVVRSKTTFKNPYGWREARLIFTCSWSDFFIEEADHWREEAWDIIRATPQHTYQILTKRPHLIKSRLPADWGDGWKHVWLGISAEDQDTFDKRWTHLRNEVPAAIRWISFEPLLESIDLQSHLYEWLDHWIWPDWAVIGGESGPDYRPMKTEWLADLMEQLKNICPVFVKQDSGAKPGLQGSIPNELWRHKEYPRTTTDAATN